MGTGTPYMPKNFDEFLLEESIAVSNGPIFVRDVHDKCSEEVISLFF